MSSVVTTQLRPLLFASYIAASARSSSDSLDSPDISIATPELMVTQMLNFLHETAHS
jgi:hypothetical protein